MDITFNPLRFLDFLPYMLKGMVVIFIIIGVIVLITLLISRFFSNSGKK